MAAREVTVHRLQPEDAAELRRIRIRALELAPGAFASGPGDDRFDVPGYAGEMLADSENAVFGAFDAARIVGVVGVHASGHRKTAHARDVWGMFVDPEYRHSGIARALMAEAIRVMREAGAAYLRLTVTDAAAVAAGLYRSLGFVECGYEPDALRVDGASYGETSMRLTLGGACGDVAPATEGDSAHG